MSLQASGVYAETYSRDKAFIKTWKQGITLALFLATLILIPVVLGPRWVSIMNFMFITAMVVVGLQITTGFAGQINLGQAAFMGVGAYAAGALVLHLDAPFVVAVLGGGVAAALFGSIFGLAGARIKGFYLALATLAAHFIFNFFVINLPREWLGASQGIRLPTGELFGFALNTDVRMYYTMFVVLGVMVAGAYGIIRSRHGRAYVAVRDDDVAAGLIGINVVWTKVQAFLVGAFYAGIGGAFWAYHLRFIQPDQFVLFFSVWYIGMIIVGGLGSIAGALVGVFVVRSAQEFLNMTSPAMVARFDFLSGDVVFAGLNLLLGGIVILFLLFQPKGLMHRWHILKQSYRVWPFPY